jgi:hypothetical protein
MEIESDEQEGSEDSNYMSQSASGTIRVRIKTSLDSSNIELRGSWDNWSQSYSLLRHYLIYAETYENYCYL